MNKLTTTLDKGMSPEHTVMTSWIDKEDQLTKVEQKVSFERYVAKTISMIFLASGIFISALSQLKTTRTPDKLLLKNYLMSRLLVNTIKMTVLTAVKMENVLLPIHMVKPNQYSQ